jgi:hypothetical protein
MPCRFVSAQGILGEVEAILSPRGRLWKDLTWMTLMAELET